MKIIERNIWKELVTAKGDLAEVGRERQSLNGMCGDSDSPSCGKEFDEFGCLGDCCTSIRDRAIELDGIAGVLEDTIANLTARLEELEKAAA